MARGTQPTKDEKALVALGRREERNKQKREEEEKAAANLKAERNALRRDNDYLVAQVQDIQVKGTASHRGLLALAATAGTASGATAQHFLMDSTTVPGKKIIIPAVGGISGLLILVLMDGALADGLGGFLLGNAIGSGITSGVKSVT